MWHAAAVQSAANAEQLRDAAQPHLTVKLHVLARVDDIEPRHPAQHSQRKEHGRPFQIASQGDPGRRGRQAQRKAEPEVRQAREPFAVGIAQEPQEHRNRQVQRPAVGQEQEGRRDESETAEQREDRDRINGEPACWQMPAHGPRIERIVVTIGQTVERHRRRPRRGHAEQDSHPVLNSTVPAVPIMSCKHRANGQTGGQTTCD